MTMVVDVAHRYGVLRLLLAVCALLIVPSLGFQANRVTRRVDTSAATLLSNEPTQLQHSHQRSHHPLRLGSTSCSDDEDQLEDTLVTSRRDLFRHTVAAVSAAASLAIVAPTEPTYAAASSATATTTATSSSSSSSSTTSPSDATVTNKVFLKVRISRQDGTFYVRDDLADTPENNVFYGTLKINLFGKNAPSYVDRFLSYIPASPSSPLDDNPLPSYGRSNFVKFNQAAGLLEGGNIPSLQVTIMNGSPAIQYSGRLLPATLWMDNQKTFVGGQLPPRISHTARGLLTHRILDVTPEFGITCRADSRQLDSTHTVFGQLVLDQDATAFLDIVQDLPTYSVDRPAADATAVDDAAAAVFSAQRDFFRKTAKSLGDTRIEKVYEGKLLRRVEVTQVGLL